MPQAETTHYIVQKFGGTSVGKLLCSITESIIPTEMKSHNVAVVCSARSGTTKSKGTTSLLLDAIRIATATDANLTDLNLIIDVVKEDHLAAAQEHIGNNDLVTLKSIQLDIETDCEKVRSLLKATSMLGEISGRTTDRVLAVGETLSCRIIAGSLMTKGIPAEVIILDDIVEQTYIEGQRDLLQRFKTSPAAFLRGLTGAIAKKVMACKGRVPVITGFFGAMPGSLISSISRGYSDLCAALCAVALQAEELQIWKEVDGIFTADPHQIKAARLLATITTEEATELTYYGKLKNVMNPSGSGTIIHPSERRPSCPEELVAPAVKSLQTLQNHTCIQKANFMTENGYYGPNKYRRRPTAVTVKEGITVVNVQSYGTTSPPKFLSSVSNCFQEHNLVIDLISSSQQMLSLALCTPDPHALTQAFKDLEELGSVSVVNNMSIVSVIGHKMRNMVGIGAEIFSALANARVNIYLISQGASEINISFVVNSQDALLALEVVHTHVLKIPNHEERENAFVKGPWLY